MPRPPAWLCPARAPSTPQRAEFFLIKIVISCDEIGIAARQRLERYELIEHQLASFSSGGSSAIGNDNFNERNLILLQRPQVTALSQPAFE